MNCPSFLKDIFIVYRIRSGHLFPFSIKKKLHPFFLNAMVSNEKSTIVHVAFPPQVPQLSGIFVFVFQKFDYDVSWLGFHWVVLVWGSLSFLNQ